MHLQSYCIVYVHTVTPVTMTMTINGIIIIIFILFFPI